MRTETLAIVFTDLKGYTATTSQQTHKENAALLKQVERVVEPVVKAFNGRVVKSIGDAYMLVFRSPTEAVQCAMAVQDRLHQHNDAGGSEEERIQLRIAMNIGEVRVHRGDVFGEPVNIAARVEGVTPAGEIYLTEALYLTMNRSDTSIERVGDYELKGIPEPVTVYRAVSYAHDTENPTHDGASNERQQLPFAGLQLSRYQRLRWLRKVYQITWSLATLGVLGAAYLRYQPSSDFTHLVEQTRLAAENDKNPQAVFAAASQIPANALEERAQVRRYRRAAVAHLIASNDIETADLQVKRLLEEDPRDAEAHMMQGILHARHADIPAALHELEQALRLKPDFKRRPEVVEAVVRGYELAATREAADNLVRDVLQEASIDALAELVNSGKLRDRKARFTVADRLKQLGADDKVDWVELWITDLKSTSCKVRKTAIGQLLARSDVRAVGPLQKFARSKGCHASFAGRVADQLVK